MIDDPPRPLVAGRTLERFTRDLTADARAGRLEPVRCRDNEVSRLIDIILRHGKNNPTLVGPAGVGKTAIVEGFAQRVAAGEVPVALRDVRVLSLDHVGLLAGTTYRGDYEERIRSLVAETMAAGDIILFIDELHNLIGQGTGTDAAMDAANMLKPSLVRGDFRVIGATTGQEYARWIENDPALERRFQKIVVHELGVPEALQILMARKERLERHHNVLIADDALRAAIALTDRHVTDRLRPDKAIDAVDEACAHMQAVTTYSPATEALIRDRLRLARGAARPGAPARPAVDGPRDGFAALERIGAELEAIFAGSPSEASRSAGRADARSSRPQPSAAPPVAGHSIASVEAELSRRLMDEGVVVRAHDIVRVVGLMSGGVVTWEEDA
ncbi:MAG TPA: AAA family ATPase [Gemmatimonadaceae bacterium]|nr:AAA family ATPase [Gemmatimonadaceae bacterium]